MSAAPRHRADRIMIAGFGPVGAACAIALSMRAGATAEITVLDGRPLSADAADPRMIAISEGSRVLLERLGAWNPKNATEIEEIHVSQRLHFGRTLIRARDYQLPALGYVMPYGALAEMLQQRVVAVGIQVMPGRLKQTVCNQTGCEVALANGQSVQIDYLVHAEGGTFGEQRPSQISRDYQQAALTAIVTASRRLAGRAFERFTPTGPIALLPCRYLDTDSYSLVWCARPEQSQRRLLLSDHAFLEELAESFGRRVGDFESVLARGSYPLGLNVNRSWPSAREPAIGNAAQTLHPVAGQGFNLGLRDALVLADLMQSQVPQPEALQQQFLRARRLDRATTVGLTDFMPRAFGLPLAGHIASTALTLLDLVPALRDPLAQQMMYGQR